MLTITALQHLFWTNMNCQAIIMIKREHEKETWDILTGVILQTFTVVRKEIRWGK